MMNPQTLIKALPQLSLRRLLFCQAKVIFFMLVLIFAVFHLVGSEICAENGMRNMLECEACHNAGFEIGSFGDVNTGYLQESDIVRPSLESICSNSNLFCFPSTLPGYFAEDDRPKSDATSSVGSSQTKSNLSWSSNHGVFMLSSGQTVSCSSNSQSGSLDELLLRTRSSDTLYASSCGGSLLSQQSPEVTKPGNLEGSKSPHIEVNPPILDWGKNSLYAPSFAFLTVSNTHSDSSLFLYEAFSTKSQFYPCNASEILLKPGEVASICFVFLPTQLGISTAYLVLQTSSGGFLIHAKGFGVESLYRVQLLEAPGISSNGRWNRYLSLFNPFDETLSVEEVTMWVSVPLGNDNYLIKTVCRVETFEKSDKPRLRSTEWLNVKRYQIGMSSMAMGPLKDWNVAPGSSEMIIDLDFSQNSEGNAFGALCVKLTRSVQGNSDIIVVPLEAELSGELTNRVAGPVSASIVILPNDAGEVTVFALSLQNKAPYLLNVITIGFTGEGSELFKIKYLEGLMLFPGSVTQVAVISYTTGPAKVLDQPPVVIDMNLDCRLTILTNDSFDPQVEIGCRDIVTICSQSDVYSQFEGHAEKSDYKNAGIRSLQGRVNPSILKAVEAIKPDELVLENWKSQATISDVSVIDHDEIIFPVVQVGTHYSKWITVQNPTQHPVLMQLILNTGQIVDDCKELDGFPEPSSSSLAVGEYALQTKYGFSIGETAVTEAYVLPNKSASLGPVVFHPSRRCDWRSSALIRNNLSGVEWVYLKGLGGSLSLGLFEDVDLVRNLEFKFSSSSLNLSLDKIHQSKDYHTCHRPLVKELHAKNMGDMPLHVRRIEVSGAECGLDGFSVHACNGFALQPGESTKLLISYRPDFSAAMVQRDLELALGSGILVIPMKATLPLYMFNLCKKSIFWTRVKKLSYLIFFGAGLMLVLFYYIPPISMSLAFKDYFIISQKSSIAIVRQVDKTYNKKKSTKTSASSNMSGLMGSVELKETLVTPKHGIKSQQIKPTVEYEGQVNHPFDQNRGIINEAKDAQEDIKDGNLSIKIGKEKRRRRKKKGSVMGLTGVLEVSSSHSGNSTPSSPLSPVTSFTPKRMWSAPSVVDQCSDFKNQLVQKVEQHRDESLGTESIPKAKQLDQGASVKSSEKSIFRAQEKPSPMKMPGKPVLLQSATFPSSKKSSPLVSTSTIAPHARAPGSKIKVEKEVETHVKTRIGHQFEYDIWGDHLFGSQLISRSKDRYAVTSTVMEDHSDSFFVLPKPHLNR